MDQLKSLPNAFYDFMVFVIPTLLLALGGVVGFRGIEVFGQVDLNSLSALSSIFVLLLILVASYEYGRIAETWSAILVQTPLKFIAKKSRFLSSPDFLASHPHAFESLGLTDAVDRRPADKWVIYFYAFVVNPGLGSDLLKRYAWEKLSRSAAFSYGLLTIASILVALFGFVFPNSKFVSGTGCFGTWEYFIVVLLLALITYYEYYKRNVWNYDLLTKTIPVLLAAQELASFSEHECFFYKCSAESRTRPPESEQPKNGT